MTSTPTPPKQGVRARERNALERIAALENDLQRLVGAIQKAFNEAEAKARDLAEIVDVFVAEKGVENVQNAIAAARTKRAQDDAAKAKDALDLALVEGNLEVVEKIEKLEGSDVVPTGEIIITGVEKDKDGNVLVPGYVQLALSSIKPQFVEKLVGQGIGFVFEVETGGTFEVTGVYRTVIKPVEEAPAEAPATPAETPAVA